MLAEHVIRVFSFSKGVYAQASNDSKFTASAWLLVVVVSCLRALGTQGDLLRLSLSGWLATAAITALSSLIAFAIMTIQLPRVARAFFRVRIRPGQLVRGLALANLWSLVGLLGLAVGLLPGIGFMLLPVRLLVWLALAAADLLALAEVTELGWLKSAMLLVYTLFIQLFCALAANGIANSLHLVSL
jgi:hypothetical protein